MSQGSKDYQTDVSPWKYCSNDCDLIVRQNPSRARAAGLKEKERKPVDPPPILQLRIHDEVDPAHQYLQNPYLFAGCTLQDVQEGGQVYPPTTSLAGTLVSSLHRLRDVDNNGLHSGFFIFNDLSIKLEGDFRLKFHLYELRADEAIFLKSVTSSPFTVSSAKSFPGVMESTFLSRSFADQGVKLKIKKERNMVRKRSLAQAQEAQSQDLSSTLSTQSSGQSNVVSPAMDSTYSPTANQNYAWNYASAGPSDSKRFRSSPIEIQSTNAAPPIYEPPSRYMMNPYQQVNPYTAHQPLSQAQSQGQPVPAPPAYAVSNIPSSVPTSVIPGYHNPMAGLPHFTLQSTPQPLGTSQQFQQRQQQQLSQQYWAQNYRLPPPP